MRPRHARLFALALLAAVFGFAYVGIVRPILNGYRAVEANVNDLGERLTRLQGIAAQEPILRSRLDELRRREAVSTAYLAGSSDSLAAATLQNRVKTVAERSGAELLSTQVMPAVDEGPVRWIGVRVHLVADMAALRVLLHAIETTPPVLFIEATEIRARITGRKDGDPSPASLDVRLTIHGYLAGGSA